MVLITGTFLEASQLPNAEIMDYRIDNEHMDIKLKTVAKKNDCFQIYIAEDRRALYTITDDISEKIRYFADDDDLIKQLSMGSETEQEDPFSEPSEPEVEVPVFEQPTIQEEEITKSDETVVETPSKDKKDNGETVANNSEGDIPESPEVMPIVLEEANTDLPDEMLQIPNISDDTDILREQLNAKDRIIAQKDGMLQDLKKSIDDAYQAQEIQLLELQKLWEDKMAEAERQIEELKGRVSNTALSPAETTFLRYANYAQTAKAISSEGFSDSEKNTIGKLSSPIKVFACGTGDSNYSLLKQVKAYIDKAPNCVIVDFSNDNFLIASLKLKNFSANSISLIRDEMDLPSMVKDLNGTRYIPTTNFNDIALLLADWVSILRKLDDFAGGRPIIMLFGSINNFTVRYTVSKLASLNRVDLYIFAKCSPIILSTLYSDVQFIPRDRINIVALDYIEVVKTVLSTISTKYPVTAFAKEIDWKKLGLK